MRRLLFISFILISINALSQNSVFDTLKYEQLRNNGGLYYLEFYTPWCGFCKKMLSETFTDNSVIDYSKKHFKAIQINAESPEGIPLAQKYFVESYPTVVFFYNDKLLGRNEGFADASGFMSVMRDMVTYSIPQNDLWIGYMSEKEKTMKSVLESYKRSSPKMYEFSDMAYKMGKVKDNKSIANLQKDVFAAEGYSKELMLKIWFSIGEQNKDKLQKELQEALKMKILNPYQIHVIAWYMLKDNLLLPETVTMLSDAEKIMPGAELSNTKAAVCFLLNDYKLAEEALDSSVKNATKSKITLPSNELMSKVISFYK